MQGKASWSIFVLGLALASAAQADALADLRGKLAGLQGDTPYRGTLSLRSTVTDGKKPATHAQLQVSVASGADGLHVGFAPALLARAATEEAAQAKNPDTPTPVSDALGKLSPDRLQAVLNMGPALLRALEGASLRSQRDEVHDGKPAHLLVFDVPSGVGTDDRDAIKHYQGTLSVWLGADGVPVAMAEQRDYQGRKFFISFSLGNDTTSTLTRVGNRLVASARRAENKTAGFGQSNHSVIETTLTPGG